MEYSSRKSQRVVRLIVDSNTFEFLDAFDAAFAIKDDIEANIEKSLSLSTLTDSKQLFDAIVKRKRTAERRLMVKMTSARQLYL